MKAISNITNSHCVYICSTQGRKALLDSPLTMENYCERFELLLYLEELQMLNDIKRYNIPNKGREYATMSKDPGNKKLLVLQVETHTSHTVPHLTSERAMHSLTRLITDS